MRCSLLLLLIGARLVVPAQTVSLADFENSGAFSLEGLEAYCDTSLLQGSTDTPGPDSDWSLMLPTWFNTCPAPGAGGAYFRMDGLVPGDQVNLRFWVKLQTGFIDFFVVYFEPPIGSLPIDPGSSQGTYFFFSGSAPATGSWYQAWMPFELPAGTPWPHDLYLVLFNDPGVSPDEYALIDDVEMEMVISTDVHLVPARPDLRLYPVPASDRIHIDGGTPANGPIEVFNARGERVPVESNSGSGTLDIEHLPSGLYLIRAGDLTGRFLKD